MRVKLYNSTNSVNKYGEGVIENAIEQFMAQPRYASFEVDKEQPHLSLMDAAAQVEKMEMDENGDIWGELRTLSTPNGKALEELLNVRPNTIDYGIYGTGRKAGDTIIDYELLGVAIFPKRNDD